MNAPIEAHRPIVTYYVAASLDGFIATREGKLDWLQPYENDGEDYGYQELLDRVDCLVMGRRTFDHCLTLSQGEWPYGQRTCRILTSWLSSAAAPLPDRTAYTDQSPQLLLGDLGRLGHRHCWLVGGGETAGGFLQAGLIDHIILTLVPTALGQGVPLFGQAGLAVPRTFPLLRHQTYPNGLTQLHYGQAAASMVTCPTSHATSG